MIPFEAQNLAKISQDLDWGVGGGEGFRSHINARLEGRLSDGRSDVRRPLAERARGLLLPLQELGVQAVFRVKVFFMWIFLVKTTYKSSVYFG